MARIVSIFQFTGRAGSAVGSKGKGGNQTGYVIDLNKVSATTTVKAIAVKDEVSSSVSTKLFTKSSGSGNEGPEGE